MALKVKVIIIIIIIIEAVLLGFGVRVTFILPNYVHQKYVYLHKQHKPYHIQLL